MTFNNTCVNKLREQRPSTLDSNRLEPRNRGAAQHHTQSLAACMFLLLLSLLLYCCTQARLCYCAKLQAVAFTPPPSAELAARQA